MKEKDIKIIVTTSNAYHHIIPIFCFLFQKYWGSKQRVEFVGYKTPPFFISLSDNFTFVSLGKQGGKKEFSTDLRKYFEQQDDVFIWSMEDTFLKKTVNFESLDILISMIKEIPNIGRVNLSDECIKQDHNYAGYYKGYKFFENTPTAKYRLSTQPSIWRRDFLLKYLTPGLSPWDFETQDSMNDEWSVVGLDKADSPIRHNEGVTRHDIFKYNLEGIEQSVIDEMIQLNLLNDEK